MTQEVLVLVVVLVAAAYFGRLVITKARGAKTGGCCGGSGCGCGPKTNASLTSINSKKNS